MKAANEVELDNGKKLRIEIDHENGFLNSVKLEGEGWIEPVDHQAQLEDALKFVQLNKVALYTKIHFFLLKNSSNFNGIDSRGLADAIVQCS